MTTPTRVCGNCYLAIRPGEYEPETFNLGTCVVCGDETFVHRVRRDEAEAYRRTLSIETTCAVCGDQCVVPGDEDPANTLCVACATDEQEA